MNQSSICNSYRSRLEKEVACQLEDAGVEFGYESERLTYTVPSRKASYTPDFICDNKIIIEAKGWFRTANERHKMIRIRDCHPELDIRFVFQNANKPIYKGSPTTYSKWAEDNGFKWSGNSTVPDEWIEELQA